MYAISIHVKTRSRIKVFPWSVSETTKPEAPLPPVGILSKQFSKESGGLPASRSRSESHLSDTAVEKIRILSILRRLADVYTPLVPSRKKQKNRGLSCNNVMHQGARRRAMQFPCPARYPYCAVFCNSAQWIVARPFNYITVSRLEQSLYRDFGRCRRRRTNIVFQL